MSSITAQSTACHQPAAAFDVKMDGWFWYHYSTENC